MIDNKIVLPYKFQERKYQLELYSALDRGVKRAICVWSRRSGKDLGTINYVFKRMMEQVGTYYYCLPDYAQGKKVIWDNIHDGIRFIDHFPEVLRKRVDNQQMIIEAVNGSIFRVIGVKDVNSLMGSNPNFIVFSEFSLMHPGAWDYMRPILAQNGGTAVFLFTPRGKNHAKKLLDLAKPDPAWFTSVKTVEDTGALTKDDIERERREMLALYGDDALFMQEYYCSFVAPSQGAYYGDLMTDMERDKRIGKVPYDPALPVHTAWDLGIRDHTVIWFIQAIRGEVRCIDCYESIGKGIDHDVRMLQQRQMQYGYVYGTHYMPHDANADEKSSGKSIKQVAEDLGLRGIEVVPRVQNIMNRIQQVRLMLPKTYIDEEKCETGIDALKSYTKIYDDKKKVYQDHPLHDWSSHFCLAEDTTVKTIRGDVRIQDVVVDDVVVFDGVSARVIKNKFVGEKDTVCIKTVDGCSISCTRDHGIFTTRGVVYADDIMYTDRIHTFHNKIWSLEKFQNGVRDAVVCITEEKGTIYGKREDYFVLRKTNSKDSSIERFGKIFMVIYLKIMKLFLLMGIGIILLLIIGSQELRVAKEIFLQNMNTKNSKVRNTTKQRMDTITIDTLANIYTELFGKVFMVIYLKELMYIIRMETKQTMLLRIWKYFLQVYTQVCTQKKVNGSEAKRTRSISLRHIGSGVKSISEGGIKKVYDITVEKHHCYYANNILVSNCDALGQFAWAYKEKSKAPVVENIMSHDPY